MSMVQEIEAEAVVVVAEVQEQEVVVQEFGRVEEDQPAKFTSSMR